MADDAPADRPDDRPGGDPDDRPEKSPEDRADEIPPGSPAQGVVDEGSEDLPEPSEPA